MDQFVYCRCLQAASAHAIDDGLSEVRWRRQAFGLDETFGAVVESDQVGKCSADVDRYKYHALMPRSPADPAPSATRSLAPWAREFKAAVTEDELVEQWRHPLPSAP